MATEYQKKAKWVEEVIVPAGNVPRISLADLPTDVTPGAREVAMLTTVKVAQAASLRPVMEALHRLQHLDDWSGKFLVADRPCQGFEWRTAPWRNYKSFEDFYRRELADVWGPWGELQTTYQKYVNGEISGQQAENEIQARLHSHGGDRRSEDFQGDNVTLIERGNSADYAIARLRRAASGSPGKNDPDPETASLLLAQVEAGEMSANAAAIEAGWRHRPTPLDQLRSAWRRASAEQRAQFLMEVPMTQMIIDLSSDAITKAAPKAEKLGLTIQGYIEMLILRDDVDPEELRSKLLERLNAYAAAKGAAE